MDEDHLKHEGINWKIILKWMLGLYKLKENVR
jgi:hypothetical protein